MSVRDLAELLSAFAAFATVILAVMELSNRSKAKRAENAMKIYADYLFVKQQLDYAVANVSVLTREANNLSPEGRKSFANTHFVQPSLSATVQEVASEFVRNVDYNKAESKTNSRTVLDFSGSAINIILLVNTFYSMIMEETNMPADQIKRNADIVVNTYSEMIDDIEETGVLLHQNLRKLKLHSKVYIILLLILMAVFFAVCIFL